MVDIKGVIDCTIDDPSGKGECIGGFLDTAKAGGDYSVTTHTGWLVLQRLQHTLGKSFTALSLSETKTEAEMYASAFDNVVAIMPIEWEE